MSSPPPARSPIGACAATTVLHRFAPGTLLEIVETRPWGAAMAQELPDVQPLDTSPDAIMQAALELESEGLWEFVTRPTPK